MKKLSISHNLSPLVWGVVLVLLPLGPVFSQESTKSGAGDQSHSSSTRSRTYDYLKRLDRNSNGILEPKEMSGRLKEYLGRMGVDVNPPVSLKKLSKKIQKRRESRSDQDRQSSTGDKKSKEAKSKKELKKEIKKDPKEGNSFGEKTGDRKAGPASGVQGFGEKKESSQVSGFGESAASRSNRSSSSNSSTTIDPKIRNYAMSLMKKYDKNNNKRLEKEEWSRMRGDPVKADKNKDGIITLEELTERLASYRQRHSSSSSSNKTSTSDSRRRSSWSWSNRSRSEKPSSSRSNSSNRPSKSSSSRDASPDREHYRLLSPTERLPSGLPDWFSEKDLDKDGQVMMHEFSTEWTDSKVTEFVRHDINGDGIITPRECLKALENQ